MNWQSDTVRDRIFAAADELYVANQRMNFPTVDAVRKKARVNMNDASTGMKDWRRSQSVTANGVSSSLPDELHAEGVAILAKFWDEANKHAMASLVAAQAGWEAERYQSDELGREMAQAYDAQAVELADSQREISRLGQECERLQGELKGLADTLADTVRDRDDAQRSLAIAILQATETEKRIVSLQHAADYARDDAIHIRGETEILRKAHVEEIDRMRVEFKQEVERERARAERDCQRYEEQAISATATAAHMRGKLEALELTSRAEADHLSRQRKDPSLGKPP